MKTKPINQYLVYGVGVLWIVNAFLCYSTVQAYRVRSHYTTAYRYYHQNNISGTIRELSAALAIDPDFVEAYNLLGKMTLQAGDYTKAAGYFKAVINMTGGSVEAYNGLAITEIVRKYTPGTPVDSQSKTMLEQISVKPESGRLSGDVFVNLGSVALAEGDPAAALAYFDKAAESRNMRMEGLVHLYNGRGVARGKQAALETGAKQQELLKQAEVELTKAELIAPYSPDVVTNRFMLRLALVAGKPIGDPARRALIIESSTFIREHGGRVRPAFGFIVNNDLGLQAYKEGRFADALAAFTQAGKLDPLAYAPALNRGVTLLSIAQKSPVPKAVEDARAVVEVLIDSTRIPNLHKLALVAQLGNVEYAAGERESCRKHFAQALKFAKLQPGTADAASVYRAMAILHYDADKYAEAIEMTKLAMQTDPSMADVQKVIDILKTPPRVTKPDLLRYDSLPPKLQPLRAEVSSEAVPDLIEKDKIDVTIDDQPADFAFAEASQIIILPRAPAEDGVHLVKVEATDKLGNKGSAVGEFRIDSTPPVVYAVNPPVDAELNADDMVEFSVELQDTISGVDLGTLKLSVAHTGIGGKSLETYPIVDKGKYLYNVDDAMAEMVMGNDIRKEKFTFECKTALTPGTYRFTLEVADKRGNKLVDSKWQYTVPEGKK